ncbi:MAG: metallophosphoesterase family protein [Clostridia bacterium]|nr:metallophosphoesterase family protein [Clostridia bacterium]
MAKNYYIADLHLNHENVIRFDNRPFENVAEMNVRLLENWNKRVTEEDTVIILGDFIWAKEPEWMNYLPFFKGNKVLIRGNHDPKEFSREVRHQFLDVRDYKELTDGGKRVILSHYPMPFHRAAYGENCWMLYGHVHMTREYDLLQQFRKGIKASCTVKGYAQGNFVNVGCMLPYMGYTPRTLEEIIEGDRKVNEDELCDVGYSRQPEEI